MTAILAVLLGGGDRALAANPLSAGCAAFNGYFDSVNGGYNGGSSGTGFKMGEEIVVTWDRGNSGSSYTLNPSLYGPSTSSHTYAFTADYTGTVTLDVNNTGGFYVSWTCQLTRPSAPPLSTTQAAPSTTRTVGVAGSAFTPVTASDGVTPYTFAVNPALPGGLSFNTATGEVTGMPTAASAQTTYTVTVTDSQSTPDTSSKTFDLTVDKGAQTITFPEVADTNYGYLPPDNFPRTLEMLATSSSGLGVIEYTTNDETICKFEPYWTNNPSQGVAGTRQNIEITGVGTCTVTASQSGNADYDAATPVQRTFNIDKGAQEIMPHGGFTARNFVANDTFTVNSVAVTGSAAHIFVAGSSSELPVNYASETPDVCSVSDTTLRDYFANPATVWFSDATVTVLAPGICTLTLSQEGDEHYYAAKSVEQAITINPPALTTALEVPSSSLDAGSAITPFIPVTAAGGYGTLYFAIEPSLPSGLDFDTTTGEISGTATAASDPTDYTVTVTDSTPGKSQTSSKKFSLEITGDAEAPNISGMPSDILVSTDPGKDTAVVTWSAPEASDNIGVTSFTSDHQSGESFPLGPTTITYTAKDAFGNMAMASFKVTVTDNEAPSILGMPSDIDVTIDYPATSSVVTWTAPTADDNDGVASLTSSHASGETFGQGATLVTYTAMDNSGNTAKASFTVTVTQTPPASVTYEVVSAGGGSFGFDGGEDALDATVDATGGAGSAGPLLVRPGSYDLAFTVPAGFGVESAVCDDGDSMLDAAAKTGTLVLAANEAVTCTVTVLDSLNVTTGMIGAMEELRARLVLEHGPARDRRLNRLKGIHSNNGGVQGFGLAYRDERLPVAVTVGRDSASFSWSLRDSRAPADGKQGLSGDAGGLVGMLSGAASSDLPVLGYAAETKGGGQPAASGSEALAMLGGGADDRAADPMANPFDLWAEGQFTRFDATAGDGTFGIVHAGADYLVNRDVLLGLGGQFDWIDMDAATGAGTAGGWGFMVGPYMTARLAPNLYLDARGAWGRSYNHTSPFGTYEDAFDGQRWLGTAALIGDFDLDGFQIRPEARLSWFRETSEAYVDSLSVAIPSVTAETGTLEFGPTVAHAIAMEDGTTVTPFTTLTGIWTFSQKNTATAVSAQPGIAKEGVRARVEAGVDVSARNGLSLSVSGHYDGIGDAGYQAYGGAARIGQQF